MSGKSAPRSPPPFPTPSFQEPAESLPPPLIPQGEVLSEERAKEAAPRGAVTCPGRAKPGADIRTPPKTQTSLPFGEGRVRSPDDDKYPGPRPGRRV